jgi:hypothetical protein
MEFLHFPGYKIYCHAVKMLLYLFHNIDAMKTLAVARHTYLQEVVFEDTLKLKIRNCLQGRGA